MSKILPLILGLVVFLGGHVAARVGNTRARLAAHFGENTYRGLHSLVALLGLALIVHGFAIYRNAGMIPVWDPPRFMTHLAMLLMLLAFILLAATWLPGKIKAKVKHPMLTAIKTWALAHLFVNGDLGSIVLFSAFLAWAVFTRIAIKRMGGSEIIPGADALAGSTRNDILAIVIGSAATFAFIYGLHKFLIGVSVL